MICQSSRQGIHGTTCISAHNLGRNSTCPPVVWSCKYVLYAASVCLAHEALELLAKVSTHPSNHPDCFGITAACCQAPSWSTRTLRLPACNVTLLDATFPCLPSNVLASPRAPPLFACASFRYFTDELSPVFSADTHPSDRQGEELRSWRLCLVESVYVSSFCPFFISPRCLLTPLRSGAC